MNLIYLIQIGMQLMFHEIKIHMYMKFLQIVILLCEIIEIIRLIVELVFQVVILKILQIM